MLHALEISLQPLDVTFQPDHALVLLGLFTLPLLQDALFILVELALDWLDQSLTFLHHLLQLVDFSFFGMAFPLKCLDDSRQLLLQPVENLSLGMAWEWIAAFVIVLVYVHWLFVATIVTWSGYGVVVCFLLDGWGGLGSLHRLQSVSLQEFWYNSRVLIRLAWTICVINQSHERWQTCQLWPLLDIVSWVMWCLPWAFHFWVGFGILFLLMMSSWLLGTSAMIREIPHLGHVIWLTCTFWIATQKVCSLRGKCFSIVALEINDFKVATGASFSLMFVRGILWHLRRGASLILVLRLGT